MRERYDPSRCRGILSVWNDVAPEQEDFYERWYMGEHFPERLGVPGFIRGRRYEAIEADRNYFTFYELTHPDVLFSDAYIARLNTPTTWTSTIMGHWGSMFRTVCERVRRKGDAIGGYVAVARWEVPADLPLDLADRVFAALDEPGIVAVDLWRATERQNEMTTEASRRPERDLFITAAMVIEGTRQKSIEKAAARLPGLVAPAEPPRIGIYRMIALQEEPY
jgi:hypothetical protein